MGVNGRESKHHSNNDKVQTNTTVRQAQWVLAAKSAGQQLSVYLGVGQHVCVCVCVYLP